MDIIQLFSDAQISTVIALVIKLVVFAIISFYIVPKQLREVFRPYDGLTALRWQILVLLSVSVITSIPSAAYQVVLFLGEKSELLREIATITNNVSSLIIVVLLVLIFNYKKRG